MIITIYQLTMAPFNIKMIKECCKVVMYVDDICTALFFVDRDAKIEWVLQDELNVLRNNFLDPNSALWDLR